MVGTALEDFAHLVDRQARARQRGGLALARQHLVEVGQALGLFAVGAEQLYHRGRSVRRGFSDLDQFLVARQFAS